MNNELATQNPASLTGLSNALTAVSSEIANVEGDFLRFSKFGEWVYGQDDIPVRKDRELVINPFSFEHGYICWSDQQTKPLGEDMQDATLPIKPISALPDYAIDGGRWDKQVSMHLVDDKFDNQLVFKTSSKGGIKAYGKVVDAVMHRAVDKTAGAFIYPVVTLDASSYKHVKYGKINTPEIELVGWADKDGNRADTQEVIENTPF